MLIPVFSKRRAVVAVALAGVVAGVAARVGAQVTDVLARPGKARAVSIDQFTPDLPVPDTAFECGPPTARAADFLLPVNAIEYTASAPNRANEQMSMSVFVDSTGAILRFAQRRGQPVRPDTRGLTPGQVGQAVQAAALQSRSTMISVDYRTHRASVANRGGGLDEIMSMADPSVIANLAILDKPGELATRVVKVCSGGTR